LLFSRDEACLRLRLRLRRESSLLLLLLPLLLLDESEPLDELPELDVDDERARRFEPDARASLSRPLPFSLLASGCFALPVSRPALAATASMPALPVQYELRTVEWQQS
jgi:hypothetical protein